MDLAAGIDPDNTFFFRFLASRIVREIFSVILNHQLVVIYFDSHRKLKFSPPTTGYVSPSMSQTLFLSFLLYSSCTDLLALPCDKFIAFSSLELYPKKASPSDLHLTGCFFSFQFLLNASPQEVFPHHPT